MRISDWSSDVCSSDLSSSVNPAIAQAWATVASRLSSRRSAVLALPLRWSKYTVTPMPRSRVDSTVSTLPMRTPTLRPRSSEHRSEEHTSELQSLMRISYAVFCLKKKKQTHTILQPSKQPQNTHHPLRMYN